MRYAGIFLAVALVLAVTKESGATPLGNAGHGPIATLTLDIGVDASGSGNGLVNEKGNGLALGREVGNGLSGGSDVGGLSDSKGNGLFGDKGHGLTALGGESSGGLTALDRQGNGLNW